MSDQKPNVPDEEPDWIPDMDDVYRASSQWLTSGDVDRFIEAVKRDAARAALDGLYADASQDYRLGVQGDDQERMDNAEAVLRAVYAWMDHYPEETKP